MANANLLAETIALMKQYGKTPADVKWVGSRGGSVAGSWEEFAARANFMYDPGFGGEEVPTNMVVVGDSWWLERHEYDGSEWWEFKTTPTRRADAEPLPETLRKADLDWQHPLNREEAPAT